MNTCCCIHVSSPDHARIVKQRVTRPGRRRLLAWELAWGGKGDWGLQDGGDEAVRRSSFGARWVAGWRLWLRLEDEAFLADVKGDEGIIAGAAAVLGDVERAPHPPIQPGFPHQDDCVGVGEDVATIEAAADEVVEQDFVGRVEEQGGDVAVVVEMLLDSIGVDAEVLAKQVAGHPIGLLVQNLVIDVLEHVELERITGLVGRFDAVDHAAADSVDEVAVEEPDGELNLAGEFDLPGAPIVFVEVAAGHLATVALEDVEQVAAGLGGVPDFGGGDVLGGLLAGERPLEEAFGVFIVRLRVATGGHVEKDARLAFLGATGLIEGDAELGLSNAGGTGNDGESARKEAAAEQIIEGGKTGGDARHGSCQGRRRRGGLSGEGGQAIKGERTAKSQRQRGGGRDEVVMGEDGGRERALPGWAPGIRGGRGRFAPVTYRPVERGVSVRVETGESAYGNDCPRVSPAITE